MQGVVDGEDGDVCAQAQRRLTVLGGELGAFGGTLGIGKPTAGARVLARNGVRGAGGFADILARAVALVDRQLLERRGVGGIAILLVSLGFNLLGDALRDVLDPRAASK